MSTYFYVETYLGLVVSAFDGHIPRQKVADLANGMVRDSVQDFQEIDLRVEAVELGSAAQRVDVRSAGSGATV